MLTYLLEKLDKIKKNRALYCSQIEKTRIEETRIEEEKIDMRISLYPYRIEGKPYDRRGRHVPVRDTRPVLSRPCRRGVPTGP